MELHYQLHQISILKMQLLSGRYLIDYFTGSTKAANAQDVTSNVLASESQCLILPNITKLLQIYQITSLTTATVERSFSTLSLVNTNLRNRLKDCTLDKCIPVAIEGQDTLSNDDIEAIIEI